MEKTIVDFLNNHWFEIVFVVLLLAIIVFLVFFIYFKFVKKESSFKESFNDSKLLQIAITIDLEEKTVTKYYLYDQNHKDEIITLDEFYTRFDKTNSEKFKDWLDAISVMSVFNQTRRKEIVMYDSDNSQSIYLVELESYNPEAKRYYLIFKDITKSQDVNDRLHKTSIEYANETFFSKANERLLVVDENATSFLVAIKYREYPFAIKELPSGILESLETTIYKSIEKMKFENDLLCLNNDTFLLFSANVVNIKKYKHHIKKILQENSGVYNLFGNRFSYTINLVAGYTTIEKDVSELQAEKIFEAENALEFLLSKNHSSERLQLFDKKLKELNTLKNNKLLAVDNVVTKDLFSVELEPIIATENKDVCGYNVNISIPHALNMELKEFIELVKMGTFTTTFYINVFAKIRDYIGIDNYKIYLSFDFESLNDVMAAYYSNSEFSKLNINFCLEFSNATMQKTDFTTIEKALTIYKKNRNMHFGITYSTLNSIYLNDKIYSKADTVLLKGQVIEQSLDKYNNELLLEVYTRLAKSYNHDIIALNVKSLAIYEMLKHFKIKKVCGSYLTPYVAGDKIVDKPILKVLSDIESKNY